MGNTAMDIRENVINDIIRAMAPVVEVIQLQMLEGTTSRHYIAKSRKRTQETWERHAASN